MTTPLSWIRQAAVDGLIFADGSLPPGVNPADIHSWFHDGPGTPGYEQARNTLGALAAVFVEYGETVAVAQLDIASGWTGAAADNAVRSFEPLLTASTKLEGHAATAEQSVAGQITSFIDTRNRVVPVPAEPPTGPSMNQFTQPLAPNNLTADAAVAGYQLATYNNQDSYATYQGDTNPQGKALPQDGANDRPAAQGSSDDAERGAEPPTDEGGSKPPVNDGGTMSPVDEGRAAANPPPNGTPPPVLPGQLGQTQASQPELHQPSQIHPSETQPGHPSQAVPGQPSQAQLHQPGQIQPGQPGETQASQPGPNQTGPSQVSVGDPSASGTGTSSAGRLPAPPPSGSRSAGSLPLPPATTLPSPATTFPSPNPTLPSPATTLPSPANTFPSPGSAAPGGSSGGRAAGFGPDARAWAENNIGEPGKERSAAGRTGGFGPGGTGPDRGVTSVRGGPGGTGAGGSTPAGAHPGDEDREHRNKYVLMTEHDSELVGDLPPHSPSVIGGGFGGDDE